MYDRKQKTTGDMELTPNASSYDKRRRAEIMQMLRESSNPEKAINRLCDLVEQLLEDRDNP